MRALPGVKATAVPAAVAQWRRPTAEGCRSLRTHAVAVSPLKKSLLGLPVSFSHSNASVYRGPIDSQCAKGWKGK